MRGGVKFYRGAARAARDYVEADRSRADDYYLAEGTGFAQRYSATAEGAVTRLPDLNGDAYEAWVGGVDPDTGELRGRVRQDEHALRFAEVVVNGPKSWSLAAELHPDIAAAYEAAQDRAAAEIVRWMGQHATTRVGPRGAQVSAPVQRLEAVSVRHYTSRGGDPHRHLHVQINARVQAAGRWRGIDTVAVRNSIGAVHGIGHATMMADPQFRQALAAHGFTLDAESGEVQQIAGYVHEFSKRAEQIAHQIDGYETEWRAAHPDQQPGPALRRAWDARAWSERRPGKAHSGHGVETGEQARARWLAELRDLGYTDPDRAVALVPTPVGHLDRDTAAGQVLARLTATRSAWNHPDLRGEAEQVIARAGIVVDPATRAELAEDITARTAAQCVPLLERAVPDHLRAWTSPTAVAVEDDITGRLAVRGAVAGTDAAPQSIAAAAAAAGADLDPAQADAAAALAGDHALVLVTGAAGAGKTTTLATTRTVLEQNGHQVLVVTPTLKAARTARRETGARTGSAAWLAYQHGWRWDTHGTWTRLAAGDVDPATGTTYTGPAEAAQVHRRDLVVVDEAGMLDQDTARAVLHIADEHSARLALVGDPHQLAAVGRGGVLDLAERWAERAVTLDVIHRFVHQAEIEPGITADVPDDEYAALSLRMRSGENPGDVFDQLVAGGHVQLHTTDEQLRNAVATAAIQTRPAGQPAAIAAATLEEVRALNAAIRARRVDARLVDDQHTTTTAAGDTIGAGDTIATRRNDRDADVANRDTWTVTGVHDDGSLSVTGPTGRRDLAADYVAEHVELAYATTLHGVQGDTAAAGHLVLDEHTGAQAIYVGMTRGRTANTVHIVTGNTADPLAEARQQWIDAARRDRTDLGIAAARTTAQHAAEQYATPTAVTSPAAGAADPQHLAQVLDQLCAAWTEQARAQALLARLRPRLQRAQADAARRDQTEARLGPLREQMNTARTAADAAEQAAGPARARLDQRAHAVQDALRASWDADLPAAGQAARVVQAGSGRLGRITGAHAHVRDAQRLLDDWAEKWQPVLAGLPDRLADPAALGAGWHADRVNAAFAGYTHQYVAAELPQHVETIRAAERAAQIASDVSSAYTQAADPARIREAVVHAATGWRDVAADLPRLTGQTTAAQQRRHAAAQRIDQLTAESAIAAQPDPESFLTAAHTSWAGDYTAAQAEAARQARHKAARDADQAAAQRMHDAHRHHGPSYRPDTGRHGPSLGR